MHLRFVFTIGGTVNYNMVGSTAQMYIKQSVHTTMQCTLGLADRMGGVDL